MKILVTGGAGYIGSHTIKELLKEGHTVVAFDNLENGHRQAVLASARLVVGNLSDKEKLNALFSENNFDAVIHFAGFIEAGQSVIDPLLYFKNNVADSIILLEVMKDNNVKKIVFSSSAAVYGEPKDVPIKEDHPTNPTNAYGLTKLMFEQMLSWADKAYGIKSVSLRYFNAAGADIDGVLGEDHPHETHLIPLILQTALGKREVVSIFGSDYNTPDGTCIRDYIHVTDLALAHILALNYLNKKNESKAFNLGNGEGFSVKEVIKTSEEVVGKQISVLHAERRSGDPARLIADSSLAINLLGWQPRYNSLNTIIESAWQWIKNHPLGYGND